jgi:hypothetical protein
MLLDRLRGNLHLPGDAFVRESMAHQSRHSSHRLACHARGGEGSRVASKRQASSRSSDELSPDALASGLAAGAGLDEGQWLTVISEALAQPDESHP